MTYFHLPNGKMTKSTIQYIRAWRKLASRLESEFGLSVIGYDPDFLVTAKEVQRRAVNLPLWFVKRILKEEDNGN